MKGIRRSGWDINRLNDLVPWKGSFTEDAGGGWNFCDTRGRKVSKVQICMTSFANDPLDTSKNTAPDFAAKLGNLWPFGLLFDQVGDHFWLWQLGILDAFYIKSILFDPPLSLSLSLSLWTQKLYQKRCLGNINKWRHATRRKGGSLFCGSLNRVVSKIAI